MFLPAFANVPLTGLSEDLGPNPLNVVRVGRSLRCLGESIAWVMIPLCLLFISSTAWSQAIPEPPQLIYGQIFDPANGPASRVTNGTLTWTFTPRAGGAPVVVTTTCTNQYAPYAFLLSVPCETQLPGLVTSSNVLVFSSPSQTYDLSLVQLNNQQVYLKHSAQNTLTLTGASRGQLLGIDLTLLLSDQDAGGNVLSDAWQMQYFGHLGVDPNALNPSGMSNLGSYLAGTNPNDPNGAFRLLTVQPDQAGTSMVSWTSVPSRTYTLRRATALGSGFQVIASGIAATGAVTQFPDHPPGGSTTYFYQVSIP